MSGVEDAARRLWAVYRVTRRHRWAVAEDQRLRLACDAGEPWPSVAKAIGLPVASLQYRCRVLGIRRKPRYPQRRCQAAAA